MAALGFDVENLSLLNFIQGKFPDRYFDNSDGIFNFMPPEHRPGGSIPLHTDWPIFKTTPRSATAFIFLDARVISGKTTNFFTWQGYPYPERKSLYPKPWPNRGEKYSALITFRNPLDGKFYQDIYKTWPIYGNLQARIGPRVSDDLENGPGYVYVNWVPISGCRFLTFGTERL